jgi:hypothetical protein
MVLTRTALDRSRLRPRRVAALAAAAAAYVGVNAALVAGPLADPGRVDIRLENPTDYDMTVLARTPDRAGHVVVATVESGDEKLVQEIVDLGDQWVFDFRQAGVDAASLEQSRAELEGSGWTVTVPASAGDRMTEAGVAPSA